LRQRTAFVLHITGSKFYKSLIIKTIKNYTTRSDSLKKYNRFVIHPQLTTILYS
jgi:hypothetical protein